MTKTKPWGCASSGGESVRVGVEGGGWRGVGWRVQGAGFMVWGCASSGGGSFRVGVWSVGCRRMGMRVKWW